MNNNKITALAAGTVSATSTDAINGSQLYAATRYFQANSTLADATAAGADSVALGPQSVSTGPSSVAIGNGATANNASDVALGAGSSTAAPHTGAFDLSGGTAAATAPVSVVSVGAAGSERQIQNVAAGVLSATSTDAVNGSQLFSVASAGNATGTSVAAALGGGSAYTPGTGVSAPSYAIGGTTFNNVGAALGNLDTRTTQNTNSIASLDGELADAVLYDTSAHTSVTLGEVGSAPVTLTNVAPGALAATSTDAVNGSQLFSVAEAGNATGTSIAAALGGGSTYTPGTGVSAPTYTIGGTIFNNVGAALGNLDTRTTQNTNSIASLGGELADAVLYDTSAHTSVTLGGVGAAPVTLTNVAPGALTATSTDAVNGSQLNTTNQNVTNVENAVTALQTGNAGIRYFRSNSTLADATATGTDSIALGPQSVSTGPSSVAIGNGATANNASDVALGAGSSTAAPHTGAFDLSGGTAAATAPVSVVSVGAAGSERQIQNVAAGVLSATSTDAVNGSQLFSVASAGNATGTSVAAALGGGSTYTPGVGVSAPSYTIGGTIFNNVGAALTGLDTDLTNLQNAVGDINDGSGIRYFRSNSTAADSQATGIDSIAIAPLAIASGADSFAAGTGAQAQAINSLAFGPQSVASVADSVAIGSGSVADRPVVPGVGEIPNGGHAIPYNTSDLTLLGAVSFGNATTGTFRQLTNVADGTQPQDAVTIRQLAGALSAFAATGTRYFHANSTAVDSLAVGAESIAVGPTTVVNGDNGIGIGNGAIVNATAPGGVAIGEAANSNQADAIAIGSGSNASGAQSVAQGSLASATQSGAVAVGSGANSSAVDSLALGAGSTASFANSVALGAGSVTTVGALSNYIAYGLSSPQSSAGEVNVGNRQITGVAGGSAGNDAVNVSQLDAVATHLTELIKQQTGGGGDFSSNPVGPQIPPGATGPNSAAGGSGSVASGANSTATGGHSTAAADNSTALGSGASATGNNSVALGANSDDGGRTNVVSVGSATNQRQVANVAAGTLPTDAVNVQQLNAGLAQANAYTDQRAAQLQDGINSTARYAYAGIAAATALTMIPEVDPGKTLSLGVGTAGYRGYQAVAIGGTARISESIKVKAGFGTSAAGTTVGVGAAMQW